MKISQSRSLYAVLVAAALALPTRAHAQVSPAAGYTPPDDTPGIKLGATIFADYTYQKSPTILDTDSNRVHLSSFNATRAYINVTGNISHLLAFRITPDITRESGTGSSLNGSLTFRVKYAFAQLNLDDWMPKGSWVRLGVQQTPWIDFFEGIYRYRFQGTVLSEREGFLSSADAGASVHVNLPSNYGDVHAGIYNGENYNKAETNNEKSLQIRGTLRPFATAAPVLRGFRATLYYNDDHYAIDAPRKRLIAAGTFEHKYLNAGVEYLKTKDQTSIKKAEVDGKGYSFFLTPRTAIGLEGFLRLDHFTPNESLDTQTHDRTIVGLAYWFPHQGNVSAAVMLDYDDARFHNFVPLQPEQQKIALHALINF